MVTECEKSAQKEYKRRHDNVAKKVHGDLCKTNSFEHTEKCYEHVPERAVESEVVKGLWDINVQCKNVIEARRPEIILIDKKERKWMYQDLKRKIGRLWRLKMVEALGSVTKEFDG